MEIQGYRHKYTQLDNVHTHTHTHTHTEVTAWDWSDVWLL